MPMLDKASAELFEYGGVYVGFTPNFIKGRTDDQSGDTESSLGGQLL